MASKAFDTTKMALTPLDPTNNPHGFTFPTNEQMKAFTNAYQASVLKGKNGKKGKKCCKTNSKKKGKTPAKSTDTKAPITLGRHSGGTARKRAKTEKQAKTPRNFASIEALKFLLDTLGLEMATLAKVWRIYYRRNLTGKCKRHGCRNVVSAGCPMFIRSIKGKRNGHVYDEIPHVFFLFITTNGYDLTTDEGKAAFRAFISSLQEAEKAYKASSASKAEKAKVAEESDEPEETLLSIIKPVCHMCYDESLNSATPYSMEAFLDSDKKPIQAQKVPNHEYEESWCFKSNMCQVTLTSGHRCCEAISPGEKYCLACSLTQIKL